MASMHDIERQANLMTPEERAELLAAGWCEEVITALQRRGFRPCKPDYIAARSGDFDITRCCGFLRQTRMPHLHITVEKDTLPHVVLERIDDAIYEAGCGQGHEALASHFNRFLSYCKNRQGFTLEARVAALEAQTQDKKITDKNIPSLSL